MEFVYHFVTIRVNVKSWAHVWRLRSRYLGTGYDIGFGWRFGAKLRLDGDAGSFVWVALSGSFSSLEYGGHQML
jgi:hypothetical protein